MKNYETTITVDQSPEEVFNAVTNPRAWWSELIVGDTDKLGAEFKHHFKDIHRATLKITELVPNQKVVWHVLENYFSFTKDKTEWVDTDIVFEISKKDGKTELHFTHIGLVPEYECYGACSEGWSTYIEGSLYDLITIGKGNPNSGEAITENEEELGK